MYSQVTSYKGTVSWIGINESKGESSKKKPIVCDTKSIFLWFILVSSSY